MADFKLQAQSPLRGYNKRVGNTNLTEQTNIAIFSIGLPLEAEPARAEIKKTLNSDWPKTGFTTSSTDNDCRLLGLQSDQVFALTNIDSALNGQVAHLGKSVYVTDQSDSWVGLSVEGDYAIRALERICPIDLHSSVFGVGRVTRTIMEHLAVIIVREDDNSFLLLSPTSSARSFLHALEISLHNVIE